jgi:hypothetical protein
MPLEEPAVSVRRAVSVAALVAVATAVPAGAAPAKHAKRYPPRVVTITYSQPCSVSPAPTNGNGSLAVCPDDQGFSTVKGERFASISVKDASGQPVVVGFNVATSGVSDQLPTMICDSATKLEVSGGQDYVVHPTFNVGDTGCPTPPTSGTITITLTH